LQFLQGNISLNLQFLQGNIDYHLKFLQGNSHQVGAHQKKAVYLYEYRLFFIQNADFDLLQHWFWRSL